MIAYHFCYRRLLLDGRRSIVYASGPVLVWYDDDEVWACDFAWHEPQPIGSLSGRGPDGVSLTIQPASVSYRYGRLWAWRSRPLHIIRMYGADGLPVATRIDFATPLQQRNDTFYQIDRYLDIFISADEQRFVISDEDELAEARRLGLVSHEQQRLVEAQRRELIDVLRAGSFATWLGEQPPFDLSRIPLSWHISSRWFEAGVDDGWPQEYD